MAWLPDGEKSLMIRLFVLTQLTNVTDGQTDRQTAHDDIGRACIASRGKNTETLFMVRNQLRATLSALSIFQRHYHYRL